MTTDYTARADIVALQAQMQIVNQFLSEQFPDEWGTPPADEPSVWYEPDTGLHGDPPLADVCEGCDHDPHDPGLCIATIPFRGDDEARVTCDCGGTGDRPDPSKGERGTLEIVDDFTQPPADERRNCAVDAPCKSCRRHIKDYGFYPDLPSHSHAVTKPHTPECSSQVGGSCDCHWNRDYTGDRPAVTDAEVEAAWNAFGEWPDELTEPMRRTMRAALERAAAVRPAPAVTATDTMLPSPGPAAAEGVVAIYTDGAHGPGWYYAAVSDQPAVADLPNPLTTWHWCAQVAHPVNDGPVWDHGRAIGICPGPHFRLHLGKEIDT